MFNPLYHSSDSGTDFQIFFRTCHTLLDLHDYFFQFVTIFFLFSRRIYFLDHNDSVHIILNLHIRKFNSDCIVQYIRVFHRVIQIDLI